MRLTMLFSHYNDLKEKKPKRDMSGFINKDCVKPACTVECKSRTLCISELGSKEVKFFRSDSNAQK